MKKKTLFLATTLKIPVLNITGSLSPHIDDTVTLNGRLEPTKTNWMKVSLALLINKVSILILSHF